jgi:hypothetical protein
VIAVIEERITADERGYSQIRAEFTGVDLAEEIFSIYLHFVFAAGRDCPREQP